MGTWDPRVDAYIAKSAQFARPILVRIREVVHAACPDAAETLKWGFPHFMYDTRILCSMAAFKAHCSFGFWHRLREAADGIEEKKQGMGQLGRITRIADLPNDTAFTRMVRKAMKLSAEGVGTSPRGPRKPPGELPVPAYFQRALKNQKDAFTHFKELSPSHRNEYVEWITGAKSEATREKRIATAMEWLADGKPRNWKYQRK